MQQFWYKYLAPEILLQKLQTHQAELGLDHESIALHDQDQAQPDKSKIFTQKK